MDKNPIWQYLITKKIKCLILLLNINQRNTVNTSCGFTPFGCEKVQGNLEVQSSQVREVTVESEVATNSRKLHTLNVNLCKNYKKLKFINSLNI
jgi:hypothetical protein